jgi:F420-0:gamma-glutamyl ligase
MDDLRLFCRKDPDTWALVMAEMEPGKARGGDRRSEAVQNDNIILKPKQGTSATYTLKRLKRDRPDLFAKVTAGTMTANAAAKKAGFRKTRTVYLPADPKAAAAKLRELFGEEFLAQVCGCLRQLI